MLLFSSSRAYELVSRVRLLISVCRTNGFIFKWTTYRIVDEIGSYTTMERTFHVVISTCRGLLGGHWIDCRLSVPTKHAFAMLNCIESQAEQLRVEEIEEDYAVHLPL